MLSIYLANINNIGKATVCRDKGAGREGAPSAIHAEHGTFAAKGHVQSPGREALTTARAGEGYLAFGNTGGV